VCCRGKEEGGQRFLDQHIKEVEIGEDWRARRTEEERDRTLKENAPVIEAIAKEVN
jgi:hypothetical protein